jgi:hypothetical protein
LLHVDLHEGTGIMFLLPRRRLLAGGQADDHVADPRRAARLQRDFARNAVALVEQAQHGDALRHRRCAIGRVGAARQIDRRHVRRRTIFV